MKLIDKDALVAEIERKKEEEVNYDDDSRSFASYADHVYYLALDSMQDFINTLEVKEVNLEKELIEWHKEHFKKDGTFIGMSGFYLTNNSQMDIAKHFFELGLHHSITKECVNEICQLFMEREAIEKFFPDSIDWVYKQLQKGDKV